MIPAFVIAGVGMTLFFVPLASLVLGSVPTVLEGVASGTNSAFRELGGVLGIAVLGAVFSSSGGYASGQDFVNGMTPAILVGAGVVLLGMITALMIPSIRASRRAASGSAGNGSGSGVMEESGTERAISDLLPTAAGLPLSPADSVGSAGAVVSVDAHLSVT